VAEHTVIGETDLLRALDDQPADRVRTFLWGLEKLGHVRQVLDQWTIGNEYLRRWLSSEWQSLRSVQEPLLDESSFEELLHVGHAQEVQAYEAECAPENRYAELLAQQHRSARAPSHCSTTWATCNSSWPAQRLTRSQGGDTAAA
jgi:hypothetical protein